MDGISSYQQFRLNNSIVAKIELGKTISIFPVNE